VSKKLQTKKIGIYFHTPYCKVKCHFCAFYVLPGSQKRVEDYFKALEKELLSYKEDLKDYEISTIYSGGGSPSIVDPKLIANFIEFIKNNLNVSKDAELSLEGSPETVTKESMQIYKNAGVNRFSMGLQAWQDEILKYLGRGHDHKTFLNKYYLAREIGFENINIDLIFGIPDQTLEQWEETLYATINLDPEHIATYSLIIDEESTFGKMQKRGRFEPLGEILDRKMYKRGKKILRENSYYQYEIANFSKPTFESRHNSAMWNDNDYIGLGASAYSRFKGQHYNNIWSIESYIKMINERDSAKVNVINNNSKDDIVDHILLKLRLNKGINLNEFKDKFKVNFFDLFRSEVEKLRTQKLIKFNGNNIMLTSYGQDLENTVGMEFV
jgi:oxygen-independent coproporphyrinogen-3 oxidase